MSSILIAKTSSAEQRAEASRIVDSNPNMHRPDDQSDGEWKDAKAAYVNQVACVLANPMPSYCDFMAGYMTALEGDSISSYAKGPMFLWMSEYGEMAHEWHAKMHASYFADKEVIVQAGREIGDVGGFDAMQAVFYVMVNFNPLARAGLEAKYAVSRVRIWWNGIHGWAA